MFIYPNPRTMHLSEPICRINRSEWFTTRLYHCRSVSVFQILPQWVKTYFLEIPFTNPVVMCQEKTVKSNLNASVQTIGIISPNQMRKSLYISPNHDSQCVACRLLWITGSNWNYVCPYINLGAFTSNSQDLKKYVCLVHVLSLFTESSHVTAEFVYINGSDGRVPPVLKTPEHQQAWYYQDRIRNMSGRATVNLALFCWTKSKIWGQMWWMHL